MATKKRTSSKKTSTGSSPKSKRIVRNKMQKTMHEFKHHELKSGGGGRTVRNPKQAIAIGLSEARRSGADIPSKPRGKKSSSSKRATKRATKQGSRTSASKRTSAKKSTRSTASSRSSSRRTATKKSTAKKSTAKRTGAKRATAKRR